MVTVISSSSSLHNIINYHEQKVEQGLAVCLEAAEYPKDACDLDRTQKLSRLKKLTELNQQTKRNSVHISLNFDPSEQLSKACLKEIAAVYMDKIGFAGQPYLLYLHFDAGHPHIHLVTTNIKANGKRIELYNVGRNQSEKARKEIELQFGLIKASESHLRKTPHLKPVNPRKIIYGRMESKQAMSNTLSAVLESYKYGSLMELNAVLGLYNITADRSKEGSWIFRHQGLMYRILNEQGKKMGVPIKASAFPFRSTLKYLSEKFILNTIDKDLHKAWLKNTIDLALLAKDFSLNDLMSTLKKHGVDAVTQQNSAGIIYEIIYVDHRSRCVFNGEVLGESYSAKAILARCRALNENESKTQNLVTTNLYLGGPGSEEHAKSYQVGKTVENSLHYNEKLPDIKALSRALLQVEEQPERMDWELKRKRKKKKRRQI